MNPFGVEPHRARYSNLSNTFPSLFPNHGDGETGLEASAVAGTTYQHSALKSHPSNQLAAIVNRPHVLLAIQGMWVGDLGLPSALPFKDCHDEHDRLGVFVYRNPWMLAELTERRMVDDISPYFLRYASSRLEPPSFLITQEEVPYYLHLPVARQTDFLKSVSWSSTRPR